MAERLILVVDDEERQRKVLAGFLRTDHGHLTALEPSTEAAQELKLLTEDCHRQLREQTRLLNQLTATLKEYYPRALEVAELTTALLREFLQAYPTPESLTALTERQWQRWARAHRLSAARTTELWTVLKQPQLPVPAHVVRAKSRLMQALVAELAVVVQMVARYRQAVDDCFAGMPAATWARTLPVGEHGITVPTLWARLGDAPSRWDSAEHLQAQAGMVPITVRSGKQLVVLFRFISGESVTAPEQVSRDLPPLGVATVVLYAAVLAPIGEELFFRGVLFRSIRDRSGFWAGALGSSIAFGLIHYIPGPALDSVLLMSVMVFTGLGLSYIYERRGSILAPMAAHVTFNVIGLILIYSVG